MTCIFGDCNVFKAATIIGASAASGVYLLVGATGTLDKDWKYTALVASIGSAIGARYVHRGC